MLFSERSIWTMLHGIGFGGAALLALAATLFALYLMRSRAAVALGAEDFSRPIAQLTTVTAVMLWLTSLVGTYIVFPPYRASPPEGATDLSAYPRSLILGNPDTAWLHAFAMETKEHLPWIATMLATAVAFAAWRYRAALLRDPRLRRMTATLLVICFVIVAYVSLLGVFVNKVAPVQ
jgi:hypothetical protein